MQETESLFDLQIDHESRTYLAESARWGKFLSIVGFIMVGLMVIFSLFAGSIFATMNTMQQMQFGTGALTATYLILAILWFFPCLYLYNFSVKAQAAIRSNDQVNLNASLKNLKGCFKFMGIFTIIMLCIYALVILLAIAMSIGGGQ